MKTLGILFTVVLIVVCFCLWVSRDNAVNESAKLMCINAKLDNTVKTSSKAIKDLTAVNIFQKATIALRNAENNAKDDKIKQLAVRFVNLQANYYKLKNKKAIKSTRTYRKKKVKKTIKRKVYKKPAKSASQIMREREYKKLMSERSQIKSSLSKAYKSLKKASGIVSKKHRLKSVSRVKSSISNYKGKLKRIEIRIKALK